jgi:hypothetical protein
MAGLFRAFLDSIVMNNSMTRCETNLGKPDKRKQLCTLSDIKRFIDKYDFEKTIQNNDDNNTTTFVTMSIRYRHRQSSDDVQTVRYHVKDDSSDYSFAVNPMEHSIVIEDHNEQTQLVAHFS